MIVTVCYLLKKIKWMFTLVQCNTSLSKNYVAHSYVTVGPVCMTGWIWETERLSALSVCLCIWNQSYNKDFSTNSHSTTKRRKHSSNFESGENVWSSKVFEFEFELRHIPNYNDVCVKPRGGMLRIAFSLWLVTVGLRKWYHATKLYIWWHC